MCEFFVGEEKAFFYVGANSELVERVGIYVSCCVGGGEDFFEVGGVYPYCGLSQGVCCLEPRCK